DQLDVRVGTLLEQRFQQLDVVDFLLRSTCSSCSGGGCPGYRSPLALDRGVDSPKIIEVKEVRVCAVIEQVFSDVIVAVDDRHYHGTALVARADLIGIRSSLDKSVNSFHLSFACGIVQCCQTTYDLNGSPARR